MRIHDLGPDAAEALEHGRLTRSRAKVASRAVNDACQALRPHALTLVEGFGIPEEWLDAPIAEGAEAARQDVMRAHDAEL